MEHTIENIEHVIPRPEDEDIVQCAQCSRELAGPSTIARSAIVINHDSDYVFCDRACAERWHHECECESATLHATGELTSACPCSSDEHPWHDDA